MDGKRMTAYKKPTVEISEVEVVLRKHFSLDVTGITPLDGGNISAVFSFAVLDDEYIIKFCDLAGSFETEKFISTLLTTQGIPFPLCMELGDYKSWNYLISKK